MKKITSTLLTCAILLACVFTLASCVLSVGPITIISGTYKADLLVSENTYEFSPLGKVTVTVDTILGDEVFEGKYKVNNETKEITFTFEDDDADILEGTFDFGSGDDDGVKYIEIGLIKYTIVD